jgi:hypothetical protein
VKAVEKFTYFGYLRSNRPLYFMFGGFFWWALGYEQKTKDTLKTLKSFTEEVSIWTLNYWNYTTT